MTCGGSPCCRDDGRASIARISPPNVRRHSYLSRCVPRLPGEISLSARSSNRFAWRAVAVVSVVAAILAVNPATSITYGSIDTEHTNVGSILVFSLRRQTWFQFCSGSLVSERVFLTAGHCTDALASAGVSMSRIRISFALNLWTRDAKWLEVSAYASHPDYNWGPTSDPHDVGVVILAKAVKNLEPSRLAPLRFLDRLAEAGLLADSTFINVGYGIDQNFQNDGYRKISYSAFRSLHDAWLYMPQNIHTGSGGTCSGDSGGPTFYDTGAGEVIVAITSWGDAQCVATNINYRMDIASSQAFIEAAIAQFA